LPVIQIVYENLFAAKEGKSMKVEPAEQSGTFLFSHDLKLL